MEELFDICVIIMEDMSSVTGLTYKEINIWLFVILHPLVTLVLIFKLIRMKMKCKEIGKIQEN